MKDCERIFPSHDLYPTMMRGTKLLVLDFDVTRYHSFDLFRYLLLDRDLFMQCDSTFYPMFSEKDIIKQIDFYKHHAYSMNPYDFFENYKNKLKIDQLEDCINNAFQSKDPIMKITPTDLNFRLNCLFEKQSVTGYLLKYKNDKNQPQFQNLVTVYQSDRILDLRMAVSIIMKHQINAVILSSIELGVILAEYLLVKGYSQQVTFIVGVYQYNYTSKHVMRQIGRMNALELKCKHEFGVFDPYTGISEIKREGDLHDEH